MNKPHAQHTAITPDSGAKMWREGLLTRVGHVYVGIFIATIAVTVILGRVKALVWFGVTLILGRSIAYLLSRRGYGYRVRAWTIVSALAAASAAFYLFAGLNPGPVLACALCVVLTALLLGRTALLVVLAAMFIFLNGIAFAIWTDLWRGPLPAVAGVPLPDVWVRTTVVSTLFWAGIAFSVLYVVSAVEQNVARLREKEEQRLESERARREAEDMALQLQKLEAVGQLAAGIAHDFNNALLVLRGWTDILRDTDSAPLREQAHDAIDQAIGQSEQLAKQLLSFGRKQLKNPSYLPIAEVVERTAETLSRLISSRIALRVQCQHVGFVLADESQLQQLVFNLVINARDALPDGGKITIRTQKPDPAEAIAFGVSNEHNWVILEVEDDGVGMDEATRQRAFEPFFTTKETGKGTGLGLSIVFGIVNQSGGHIRIRSEPGRGTRFIVLLPSVNVAPVVPADVDKQHALPGLHGRVLVLEDDPLARELIVFTLTRENFTVVEATNGDEALDCLRSQDEPFDILSADAVFPGASLNEVIKAFEQSSPNGQVLICSGYVPDDLVIKSVEPGYYEQLPKPFTAEQLTQKAQALLARRHSPGPDVS